MYPFHRPILCGSLYEESSKATYDHLTDEGHVTHLKYYMH